MTTEKIAAKSTVRLSKPKNLLRCFFRRRFLRRFRTVGATCSAGGASCAEAPAYFTTVGSGFVTGLEAAIAGVGAGWPGAFRTQVLSSGSFSTSSTWVPVGPASLGSGAKATAADGFGGGLLGRNSPVIERGAGGNAPDCRSETLIRSGGGGVLLGGGPSPM